MRANSCKAHREVVRNLAVRFGELRRDGCMNGAEFALEIWSSVFGGWTVLMVRPDGVTCVTTEGDLWQEAPPGQPVAEGLSSRRPIGRSA